MKKLIQKGNSKLAAANIYMFNLPATREVCGMQCRGCYAIGEQKRYPTVLPARQARYEASLQPDFSSRVVSEINRIRNRPTMFRIHSSGEFYDQAYINKWYTIASKLPDITFYAYTKRMKEFDFSKLKSLPNFVVIDSFHYGGLNYGKLDKAPKDAFICPEQPKANVSCGKTCTWCMDKQGAEANGVFFKQH